MKKWLFIILLLLVGAELSIKDKKTPLRNFSADGAPFLHLNIGREPTTLDPRKGGDIVSASVHFLLFNGLTRLGHDGKVELTGASSYTLSADKLTYTFYLPPTTWSNGTPVTAYDYEYSWKKIVDPSFPAPNAHLLYPIKNAQRCKMGLSPLSELGVQATGNNTLVVTLERPTPYFLELLSFCVFFPVSKEHDIAYPDWSHNRGDLFVSNGPFLLKEWKHQHEIVVVKNKKYIKEDEVKLAGVHMLMVQSESTALQMYEKGELDMLVTSISHLPIDSLESLKKRGCLHVNPASGSTFCAFNTERKLFSNINIRKAFAYAINRQEIVDNITQLGELIATGPVPPILKGGKNRLFFQDGDVAAANYHLELGLQELGLKKEELGEISYMYTNSETNDKIAQAIQQQIKNALGIKVNLLNTEHKILLDKLSKRQYDIAQTFFVAQYNDQMSILERFAHKENIKNYPGWEDMRYLRLLTRSNSEFALEARHQTLEEAEEIFIDQMPLAPLFHMNCVFLIQPYIRDVAFTPMGFINIERLAIDRDRE